MIKSATLGRRWGVKRERSSAKEDWEGSTSRGTRVSLVIVQMRPRWDGEETRVLKASWSSSDAVEE